jgi:hypothetical protein
VKILPEKGWAGIDARTDFDVNSRMLSRVVTIRRRVCAVRVGASWTTVVERYIDLKVVETGLILQA